MENRGGSGWGFLTSKTPILSSMGPKLAKALRPHIFVQQTQMGLNFFNWSYVIKFDKSDFTIIGKGPSSESLRPDFYLRSAKKFKPYPSPKNPGQTHL
jgi:hypothetical protein